ncbi:hypothetical protein SCALM49S_03821 [Streptomyces californicus]
MQVSRSSASAPSAVPPSSTAPAARSASRSPYARPDARAAVVGRAGRAVEATADAAYGIFQLASGAVAQINSSWTVRVNRDELVEFQVDGTHGSAVAGLRNCRVQHRSATPKPVWNPDLPVTESFRDQWQEVPDNQEFDNGFKAQAGAVPAPRGPGRAVRLGPAGRRPGRPTRRAGPESRPPRAAASTSRS